MCARPARTRHFRHGSVNRPSADCGTLLWAGRSPPLPSVPAQPNRSRLHHSTTPLLHHSTFPLTNQFNTAFCACNRFSAWSKIVSALASKVSSSISFPREPVARAEGGAELVGEKKGGVME